MIYAFISLGVVFLFGAVVWLVVLRDERRRVAEKNTGYVSETRHNPAALAYMQELQLPESCDGCGHPPHAANECQVLICGDGERCECDEPLEAA